MAHIEIKRIHSLTQDEITEKVGQLIIKLNKKLSLKSHWESAHCLKFSRKGLNGKIDFSEGFLHISIQLGMMYRAVKSSIEQEVNNALDSYLASDN